MKSTEFYFFQQDFDCIGMYSVSNAGKFCKWLLMCRLQDLKIKRHTCLSEDRKSLYVSPSWEIWYADKNECKNHKLVFTLVPTGINKISLSYIFNFAVNLL